MRKKGYSKSSVRRKAHDVSRIEKGPCFSIEGGMGPLPERRGKEARLCPRERKSVPVVHGNYGLSLDATGEPRENVAGEKENPREFYLLEIVGGLAREVESSSVILVKVKK